MGTLRTEIIRPGNRPNPGPVKIPARRHWRVLRKAAVCVLALVLLPYLLTPIYALINPPVSALMLIRGVQGNGIDYRWADIEDIAAILPATVVMREDARFCEHNGIDWGAVREVVRDVKAGKRARGASTITMQLAKNLFLWPGRSYIRKALELPLAMWLDLFLSKRRIIEIYLNVVEWGPGIYGAEAASHHHFKRTAGQLSAHQAALLTAALPNPLARTAGRPGRLTQRLALTALRRAKAAGPWTKCVKR